MWIILIDLIYFPERPNLCGTPPIQKWSGDPHWSWSPLQLDPEP